MPRTPDQIAQEVLKANTSQFDPEGYIADLIGQAAKLMREDIKADLETMIQGWDESYILRDTLAYLAGQNPKPRPPVEVLTQIEFADVNPGMIVRNVVADTHLQGVVKEIRGGMIKIGDGSFAISQARIGTLYSVTYDEQ